jgi:histidinol dehydrogenase
MRRIGKDEVIGLRRWERHRDIEKTVASILTEVEERGDSALRDYTRRFDRIDPGEVRVPGSELIRSYESIDPQHLAVLRRVANRIREFAQSQKSQLADFVEETAPGVKAGQRIVPMKRIGIYVPGGNFPLVSTLLMCAVPAATAGVEEVIVCTPPRFRGVPHPLILAAAHMLKIEEVYAVGGIQAVGAMAFGTQTISPVDLIVGPGNRYVAEAKKQVYGRVGIDFFAGPSEILIVADAHADPHWIAADLIAQAEHDREALPMLVTTSTRLADRVVDELVEKTKEMKSGDRAAETLARNGLIVKVDNLEEAVEVADRVAPEHLELHIADAAGLGEKFHNYGTLFFGARSTEALGDYSAGINHTLPTNGASRYTGGLSVFTFLKIQTTLEVTPTGIGHIGPDARMLAEMEGLEGHVRSIDVRL